MSFVRHSTASAPCAGAGSISSKPKMEVARFSAPIREEPASATTIASYSPASTFAMRVSTLPRIGRTSRSPRIAEQLRRPPRRCRAHDRPRRQLIEPLRRAPDEGVARVFAQGDSGDDQARRALRRQVLVAVDGEIDFATEQRILDRRREPARAFARGERRRLVRVARRRDQRSSTSMPG